MVLPTLIHLIAIYAVDSIIQTLKIWAPGEKRHCESTVPCLKNETMTLASRGSNQEPLILFFKSFQAIQEWYAANR